MAFTLFLVPPVCARLGNEYQDSGTMQVALKDQVFNIVQVYDRTKWKYHNSLILLGISRCLWLSVGVFSLVRD